MPNLVFFLVKKYQISVRRGTRKPRKMPRTRYFCSKLPNRQHCSHCFFFSKRRSRMQNVNKRRHGTSGRKSKYCRKLLFMFLLNLDFKAGHRKPYRQTATLQTSHRRSHLDSNARKRGGRTPTDTSSLLRVFRGVQIPIETIEQHDPIEQSESRVRRRCSNSYFQRSRRSMCPSPG
jgi:hypothetical protein